MSESSQKALFPAPSKEGAESGDVQSEDEFGGLWTEVKLDIVEKYLKAYTTALKWRPRRDRPFKLLYIDAFAGSGWIVQDDPDNPGAKRLISGSADRAAQVDDKPFDRLIFVEKNPRRCGKLEDIRARYHHHRNIEIYQDDANLFLKNLREDWRNCRGVLFLDPYAVEVEWSTIEKIAGYRALDVWILFPIHAVVRMLNRDQMPEEHLREKLTQFFGNKSWERLYQLAYQYVLLGEEDIQEIVYREQGVDALINVYRDNLRNLFGPRLLEQSKRLGSSSNPHLFELFFCAGSLSERAIRASFTIARHLINTIGNGNQPARDRVSATMDLLSQ